jgi:hypothetical protein
MACMPIYPLFHIGDHVKAQDCMIYSKHGKPFTKYDVTVKGIVIEIILRKSILDGGIIYLYRLDDGKVYSEFSMTLEKRA